MIQKHIRKLFPGINSLSIESRESRNFITSICSAEGEQVALLRSVEISERIEQWLNDLVVQITETLRDLVVKCCAVTSINIETISKFPEQVLCLAKRVEFTKLTEKAIASMSLQNQLKSIKDEIKHFSDALKTEEDRVNQLKLRAILIDAVHRASIIQQLIDNNVTNVQDWFWLQQIKFQINATQKTVAMKVVYAEFDYSFEYLGNRNHLVNTKLTHKCYLCLTQAMHLGLGGNPFGPAGEKTIDVLCIFAGS